MSLSSRVMWLEREANHSYLVLRLIRGAVPPLRGELKVSTETVNAFLIFEVLTAVEMYIFVFWAVTSCSLFGG
jgi:hypothetical protein